MWHRAVCRLWACPGTAALASLCLGGVCRASLRLAAVFALPACFSAHQDSGRMWHCAVGRLWACPGTAALASLCFGGRRGPEFVPPTLALIQLRSRQSRRSRGMFWCSVLVRMLCCRKAAQSKKRSKHNEHGRGVVQQQPRTEEQEGRQNNLIKSSVQETDIVEVHLKGSENISPGLLGNDSGACVRVILKHDSTPGACGRKAGR